MNFGGDKKRALSNREANGTSTYQYTSTTTTLNGSVPQDALVYEENMWKFYGLASTESSDLRSLAMSNGRSCFFSEFALRVELREGHQGDAGRFENSL